MKVFANKVAQERKERLEKSISAQIQYQYPPLLASRRGGDYLGEAVRLRISWDEVCEEVKIATGASPREVLEALGKRLGRDSKDRFLKVIHDKMCNMVMQMFANENNEIINETMRISN